MTTASSSRVAASASAASIESLTRRASLNMVSAALRQVARFFTSFIVSPIIIRGLGVELYGSWMMIQQTVGYLSLSDLRASGTLKYTLATSQHSEDDEQRRRHVGAALLVWARMLPIILALGAITIWATPRFIRTASEHVLPVRAAMAFAILNLAIDQLFSLPGNVLRGMNLDFKAMGLTAFVILVSGLFSVAAIKLGWGLPGVSFVGVLGAIILGAVRYRVARKELPWFGVARPTRAELSSFARLTGWLFAGSIADLLLYSSDLLLIGIVLGPKAAAIYATTGAVLRMIIDPVFSVFGAVNPGVAGICGRRDWERLQRVRLELHSSAVTAMAIIGVGVVMLNEAFLRLWIGPGFYGGMVTNILLVLIAFEGIPLRADTAIVDGLLQFRPKALITAVSGALGLVIGAIGAPTFGLPGIAIGTMIGRSINVIAFPILIRRGSGISAMEYARVMVRPVSVALVMIALAARFPLHPETRLGFALATACVGAATALLAWGLGLPPVPREQMRRRFVSQLSRGPHRAA